MTPSPPRLVTGVALLLWGGMTGHPFLGLLLAAAVEYARRSPFRWDFGRLAFHRSWQISVLLFITGAGLIALNEDRYSALSKAMVWLPLVLFPLEFVQIYGFRRNMPVSTFSLFLRRRRDRANRLGLPFRDPVFHFGHTYFAATLLSSALGPNARGGFFLPAAVVLVAWALLPRFSVRPRLAPVGLTAILLLAGLGGMGGQYLIVHSYEWFSPDGGRSSELDYSRVGRTSIGKLGEIKTSPEIVWRLFPRQGDLPKLVRISSYNRYFDTKWLTDSPPDPEDVGDFKDPPSVGVEKPFRVIARSDDESTFLDNDLATSPELPRFVIRGSLPRLDLLPVPGDAASVVLEAQDLEINSFGSLRVDPRHPVADALVLWQPGLTTAREPWPRAPRSWRRGQPPTAPDLTIPDPEKDAVRRLVDELGLRDLPLDQKIARLRGHFMRHFKYTRYNQLPRPGEDAASSFVTRFLDTTRSGHCEYFGTATALILREAGVPTRYATGFAVVERDKKGTALLRGHHAHAWAIAWDADQGTWIDVDLTPPDWTGFEQPRLAAWQGFIDWFGSVREDFLVWRTKPGNLALALLIASLPFVAGGILIGRRLWRSKQRLGTDGLPVLVFATEPSPLDRLEKPAARLLGPRPPSIPLARWLEPLRERLETPSLLDQALTLHRRLRFDPLSDPDALAPELHPLTHQLAKELRQMS